jgi:glycosyltransferase involved in cell wall biosynthesis
MRPRLLIVGAFPSPGQHIHGGIVSSCRALMSSSLPGRLDLALVDSTARSVPPPSLFRRILYSIPRQIDFFIKFHRARPAVILVFASHGMSFIEKGLYCGYARMWSVQSILFLRGGAIMDAARRSRWHRLLTKIVVLLPSRLACQGAAWREFFVNDMKRSADICPIIPNWTATENLLELGSRRHTITEQAPKEVRFLFMGWVDETKGVLDLINAFYRLQNVQTNQRLRLDIAGEGTASERARALVDELDLRERIRFLGWVDGESKLEALSSADVFCLPSYREGLPNAMIEAMAAGLPVVVTPVGNVRDAVIDGQHGLLVPMGNVGALTEALRTLAESASMRSDMGSRAFARAKEVYSAEAASTKICDLVYQLVEQAPSPADVT